VDPRGERIGRNEAVFREINERLKEIGEGLDLLEETAVFVCECANSSCSAPIRMSLSEYEQIRADPELFFVVPGHEILDVESVVETGKGYDVVRKHQEAAEVARERDPRP
jgi:hypothetical protein